MLLIGLSAFIPIPMYIVASVYFVLPGQAGGSDQPSVEIRVKAFERLVNGPDGGLRDGRGQIEPAIGHGPPRRCCCRGCLLAGGRRSRGCRFVVFYIGYLRARPPESPCILSYNGASGPVCVKVVTFLATQNGKSRRVLARVRGPSGEIRVITEFRGGRLIVVPLEPRWSGVPTRGPAPHALKPALHSLHGIRR